MFATLKNDSKIKKLAAATLATVLLAACGGGSDGPNTAQSTSAVSSDAFINADDHVLGDANAPITVVEYASVTCGACGNWHSTVYPDFKEKYIDSGKVRFVFREFEINPSLDFYGFTIANCAGEKTYFKNIATQFKRQQTIIKAAQERRARQAYESLAKSSGISVAKFEECLADEDWRARYKAKKEKGIELDVQGTPTFFVNGQIYRSGQFFSMEQIDEIMNPLLNATPATDTETEPAE